MFQYSIPALRNFENYASNKNIINKKILNELLIKTGPILLFIYSLFNKFKKCHS